MQQRNHGGAVGNIFLAQQLRGEFAETLTVVPEVETGRVPRRVRRLRPRHDFGAGALRFGFDAISGERIEPVGNGAGPLGEEFSQTRVIRAENQQTARVPGESLELAADGFQIGVVIEVLGVHVQHDGVFGLELAQRAVAFVGLHHKMRGAPCRVWSEAGVAFELRHPGADGVARPGLQPFERQGEQRAGRCFTVHAGHTDAALLLHQRGQQRRAADHRNFPFARNQQFRIVRPDGR